MLIVETLSLLWRLQLCQERGVKDFKLEVDSQVLIQLVKSRVVGK